MTSFICFFFLLVFFAPSAGVGAVIIQWLSELTVYPHILMRRQKQILMVQDDHYGYIYIQQLSIVFSQMSLPCVLYHRQILSMNVSQYSLHYHNKIVDIQCLYNLMIGSHPQHKTPMQAWDRQHNTDSSSYRLLRHNRSHSSKSCIRWVDSQPLKERKISNQFWHMIKEYYV